ncbi:MAG TPA: lysophospholipid acyltransferase family protein [Candidatus Polarisedimenticolaceae bacterium]
MWLYRVNLLVAPATRWFWRVEVHGAEHAGVSGPLIVAANHASYMDPWFVGGFFPRRPVRFLINEPWFRRSPLWTAAFRSLGVVPADAKDPLATVQRVVAALREGATVAIFPEGRISRDGSVGSGRPGIGRIAAESGAPVVPCGIRGTYESLPRHRWVPRRSTVELHLGRPLFFPGAPTPFPSRGEVGAFVDRVMASIADLAARPSVWNTSRALTAKEAP